MDGPDLEFSSAFNDKYSALTKRIIRELSNNARVPVNRLAVLAGSYRRMVSQKLKQAEEQLGIKYTMELNEQKLGLSNGHLILAKFLKKPEPEKLARILASSHVPQIAATLKGHYDLMIYANAQSGSEYVHWDKITQIRLSEYGVLWEPSDVAHRQLGFILLRNELLQRLDLPDEYRSIMLLLNQNSRLSFSDMSKKLNMHFNTVAYRFNKLVESKYIKRFTISMDPVPGTKMLAVAGKYIMKDNFESDASVSRKALMDDDKSPIASRYVVVNQLVGSYDFFSMGIFDSYDAAITHDLRYYKKAMHRHLVRAKYAEVDRVILGRLPIRSVDNRKEYDTIRWTTDNYNVSD